MSRHNLVIRLLPLFLMVSACSDPDSPVRNDTEETEVAAPEGPHGGRLLEDGDFAVELSIYETGVPPEYRAWVYQDGEPVPPGSVQLQVTLDRLGDVSDEIGFEAQGDMLRGDTVIYEPHSFAVKVEAVYGDEQYRWQFDSFEGRTTISPEMSQTLGIRTEMAGSETLQQTLDVTGVIRSTPQATRQISARFEGEVQSVVAELGETVEKGQDLITIESNESLTSYTIKSPINGIVTRRAVNPGEQTGGRSLMEIMDPSQLIAELAIYPGQRDQVEAGDTVLLRSPVSDAGTQGRISGFSPVVGRNQAVIARVSLPSESQGFPPGSFVEATIHVDEFEAPLAVRREALQPFRDFTVVYAKVGNTYEVRMLELGRQDNEWVEVLGGLKPGTEYVTTNSYIIKADVEKSGATHDH